MLLKAKERKIFIVGMGRSGFVLVHLHSKQEMRRLKAASNEIIRGRRKCITARKRREKKKLKKGNYCIVGMGEVDLCD